MAALKRCFPISGRRTSDLNLRVGWRQCVGGGQSSGVRRRLNCRRCPDRTSEARTPPPSRRSLRASIAFVSPTGSPDLKVVSPSCGSVFASRVTCLRQLAILPSSTTELSLRFPSTVAPSSCPGDRSRHKGLTTILRYSLFKHVPTWRDHLRPLILWCHFGWSTCGDRRTVVLYIGFTYCARMADHILR